MKSKILITLSVLLSFTFLNNEVQAENIQKGITVDIARKSYSLETLKTIVKYIHDHNGQYLQLHFLDDENYAIESEYFDRKSFSDPHYLTKTEVKSLIEYSNDLNVMVMHEGVKSLNYHYSILYWKQNEDNKSNLTVEDFDKYYFDVYNYNYYSLYFLPSKQFSQDDINEQAEYIGWAYAYNKFYYNKNPYNEVNSQNVKGSALSFWGEHATDMTQEELINQEVPLIKAYFNLKK